MAGISPRAAACRRIQPVAKTCGSKAKSTVEARMPPPAHFCSEVLNCNSSAAGIVVSELLRLEERFRRSLPAALEEEERLRTRARRDEG